MANPAPVLSERQSQSCHASVAVRSSNRECDRPLSLFSPLLLLLAILLSNRLVASSFADPFREFRQVDGYPIRSRSRAIRATDAAGESARSEATHRRLQAAAANGNQTPADGLSGLHEKLGALWEMASRVALNGTVIIASSNAGYEDMLENWVSHLERVGLSRHFIAFAADPKSLEFANSRWPGQAIHLDLSGQFGEEEQVDVEGASNIGSAAFHRVASHRAIYIHHLLSFGFSVLYSDIDIAFLHNPLPFFQPTDPPAPPPPAAAASGAAGTAAAYGTVGSVGVGDSKAGGEASRTSDFDMFLTRDQYVARPSPYIEPAEYYGVSELPLFCSCFLFFRPTAATKSLVGNWAFRMAKLGRKAGLDQDHLNLVMHWMHKGRVMPRIGVLPPLQFPSGQLMRDHWELFEEVKGRLVMVHANYLTGKKAKIGGLKKAGLWRVKEAENGTAAAANATAATAAAAAAGGGGGATAATGAAAAATGAVAAATGGGAAGHSEGKGSENRTATKGSIDRKVGTEEEEEEEGEEPSLLFPMPRRSQGTGADGSDESPGMLQGGEENGGEGSGGRGIDVGGEKGSGNGMLEGLEGKEGKDTREAKAGGKKPLSDADWEGQVMRALEPWMGEHLTKVQEWATRTLGQAGIVVVTVACDGQESLLHNWYTHMGRIPSLGNFLLASVPPQVKILGGHGLERPKESSSPAKARATCLLLPPLLIARLLAANFTVIYSDVNSVWLKDARPFFPPTYPLVLPSLAAQDLNDDADRTGNATQQQSPVPANTTAPLTPSLIGSLSPWLMALRPSPPAQAMLQDWALRTVNEYQQVAAVAVAKGGVSAVSGSEILKTSLNRAVAEMLRKAGPESAKDAGLDGGSEGGPGGVEVGPEGGNEGIGSEGGEKVGLVGVLPGVQFPPGWRAVGDRTWLEAHRRDLVAVHVSCGDTKQQETCLRDMKIWL